MAAMPRSSPANGQPAARAAAAAEDPDKSINPPQARQRRRQHTEGRLLDAALALLREGGLPACTVPAVSDKAGVAVGTVYRRFIDKDALLDAVFSRWLDGKVAGRASCPPALQTSATLQDALHAVVDSIVDAHGRDTALIQALSQFARGHADPMLQRRAQRASRQALQELADALASRHADAIAHTDARRAARFAVVMMAATLRDLLLGDRAQVFSPRLRRAELSRSVIGAALAYLQTAPAR